MRVFLFDLDAVNNAQGTNQGTDKSDHECGPNSRRETWCIAVERNERCCGGLATVEATAGPATSQVSTIRL